MYALQLVVRIRRLQQLKIPRNTPELAKGAEHAHVAHPHPRQWRRLEGHPFAKGWVGGLFGRRGSRSSRHRSPLFRFIPPVSSRFSRWENTCLCDGRITSAPAHERPRDCTCNSAASNQKRTLLTSAREARVRVRLHPRLPKDKHTRSRAPPAPA